MQLGEEMDFIRNKPVTITTGVMDKTIEAINVMNYKKKPHEFVVRFDENLESQHETKWHMIRSLLDELFKDIYDHWWTATRSELTNYEESKPHSRQKY